MIFIVQDFRGYHKVIKGGKDKEIIKTFRTIKEATKYIKKLPKGNYRIAKVK